MGEITAQRERLFKIGYSNICTAMKTSKQLPLQMGLSRELILDSALVVYEAQVLDLMEVAGEPNAPVSDFDVI